MKSSQYPNSLFQLQMARKHLLPGNVGNVATKSIDGRRQNCGLINRMPVRSISLGSFRWWLPNNNKGRDEKITVDRDSVIHSFTHSLAPSVSEYWLCARRCFGWPCLKSGETQTWICHSSTWYRCEIYSSESFFNPKKRLDFQKACHFEWDLRRAAWQQGRCRQTDQHSVRNDWNPIKGTVQKLIKADRWRIMVNTIQICCSI